MPIDEAQRGRILASGLFDPVFYRSMYGPAVDAGGDPLRHFLDIGLAQGHLPCAGFDPVLYRVLVPECGEENPLLHHIESKTPYRPGPLATVLRGVVERVTYKNPIGSLEVQLNRGYARDAANPCKIDFTVDARRYELTVPVPEALLERLRADQPFAMGRLPEGFWEGLWMLRAAEAALREDPGARALTVPQRRALAERICAVVRPGHGLFAPSFSDEMLDDISRHAGHPDFLRGVSFKGYPTHDESLVGYRTSPPRDELARLFGERFQPGEVIYDGTLWKRLLIAGYLKKLPDLCRGHPVILVGPGRLAGLGERWQLDRFTHVEIPLTLSQYRRWELLARARAAIESCRVPGARSPVVLTQCGGSLAYWLFARLFSEFPGAFYLDLGQALDGWFFDILDLRPPWIQVYARPVIANNGLEPFYRQRKGAEYDAWFGNLP